MTEMPIHYKSPAIGYDGNIYVVDNEKRDRSVGYMIACGNLHAIDTDGKEIWRYIFDYPDQNHFRVSFVMGKDGTIDVGGNAIDSKGNFI